jgi:hypothetical protein
MCITFINLFNPHVVCVQPWFSERVAGRQFPEISMTRDIRRVIWTTISRSVLFSPDSGTHLGTAPESQHSWKPKLAQGLTVPSFQLHDYRPLDGRQSSWRSLQGFEYTWRHSYTRRRAHFLSCHGSKAYNIWTVRRFIVPGPVAL